jgi:omega-6 fatty acid desaturase (delta-12 desaturase)
MWQTIGLKSFLLVQLPINLLAGPIGIWLFYMQHQFEDTYWARDSEWDFFEAGLEGSSFYDLPAVLHWFTGNIGFHHVHHLSSRIPNYQLQRCFSEVEELHDVSRLGLLASLGCLRLKLWDEDAERLVGFRRLRAL